MKTKFYSIPFLKRLPTYLRELRSLRAKGEIFVSSPVFAEIMRIDAISVRKDMENVGGIGAPGVGYRVEELIDRIETFLGWKNTSEVFLVGTTELGRALLGYPGFQQNGLRIIAAFDHEKNPEPELRIHEIPVFPLSEFAHLRKRLKIRMAILCVPDEQAQEIAEVLAAAGIQAIWNFTQHPLRLPENIIRQRVDLGGDLAVLSVRLAEKLHHQEDPE